MSTGGLRDLHRADLDSVHHVGGDDPTPGLLTALIALVVTGVLLIAWLPDHRS